MAVGGWTYVVIAHSGGDVRRQFDVCLTARAVEGRLAISDESTELRFVGTEEIGRLPMHHTQRLRIRHSVLPPLG